MYNFGVELHTNILQAVKQKRLPALARFGSLLRGVGCSIHPTF